MTILWFCELVFPTNFGRFRAVISSHFPSAHVLSLLLLELQTHTLLDCVPQISDALIHFSLFFPLCFSLSNFYWPIIKFNSFSTVPRLLKSHFILIVFLISFSLFPTILIFLLKFPYVPVCFTLSPLTHLSCWVFRTCLVILTSGSSLGLLLLSIFFFWLYFFLDHPILL